MYILGKAGTPSQRDDTMTKTNDTIEIRELYLSSYLLALGFEAEVRTVQNLALFIFPDTPAVQGAVETFRSNTSIPILDYLNAYNQVRNFALDHKHGRPAVWRGV